MEGGPDTPLPDRANLCLRWKSKKKKEGKGKEAEENLRRPAFLLLVFLALHQTRGSSGVEYSKTYTHVNTSWSGRRV